MNEAQRLRRAKVRGESEPSAPAPARAPKAKRKLSAATKAKLVANLRKARAAKSTKGESDGKEVDGNGQEEGRCEKGGDEEVDGRKRRLETNAVRTAGPRIFRCSGRPIA